MRYELNTFAHYQFDIRIHSIGGKAGRFFGCGFRRQSRMRGRGREGWRPVVSGRTMKKISCTMIGRRNSDEYIYISLHRFVTANRGPERATETRQYDLLRPNVGEKEPPSLGNTICYGQTGPERATKTRQYDLLRPRVGQKEPPRFGSTICYDQTWARKSQQDSAVRFVTAKICYGQTWARKSQQDSAVRFITTKSCPERAAKTRQYDLLRPRVGQKEPPRLGSTICYSQELARKSHQDSAVRFVTAKRGPERATKTLQYDLLRPRVGQKEPPRLGSTICHGQTWARKSHQNSAVRFVTAKSWPEKATKTRQYDLIRPRVGQKKPARLGSTICYGQELARKSHQDSAVRFVTAKRGPERATKTRQYDLLQPRVG